MGRLDIASSYSHLWLARSRQARPGRRACCRVRPAQSVSRLPLEQSRARGAASNIIALVGGVPNSYHLQGRAIDIMRRPE